MAFDHLDSVEPETFGYVATFLLVLGGFIATLGVYVVGVSKNKNNNNFVMFNTLLISYDWSFDIIFTIWCFASRLKSHLPIVSLSLLFIVIFVNFLLTFTILRREINNNEQFRVWFQEHKAFGILIAFFSLGNTTVLHVLNCRFNNMDKFNAVLSSTAEKRIIHASVIGLILGDLPQFFLLVSVNTNLINFHVIPITAMSLNILVNFFGFFYRIYEATIREYETPTVVNKKQLEA
ncbi:6659_t:CDS:2 [Funneliformis caledonium]|uniref:6659_t:CDS:1 n=1 Tax=Funneliformis caledonium TaxID=1117310 RepID=A0A9N9HRZ1_9GLOM|nr:6659_t:CDS:2 [Funneliformis caledonium]